MQEDSYTNLMAAVEEQEESLRVEKQLAADLKREESKHLKFELDVVKHDVQALKTQVRRSSRHGAASQYPAS